MKIIILGAGLSGVLSAYFLAKSGHKVVVIDKNDEAGLGCSYENGGQLSFSHSEGWCSAQSLRFIKNSIFSFNKRVVSFSKFPNPYLVKWIYKAILNSYNINYITERLLNLGKYSKNVLNDILNEYQMEFSYKKTGILHFYRRKKYFEEAKKQAILQEKLGCEIEILNKSECLNLDYKLNKLAENNNLSGGIYFPNDAVGNSKLLVDQIVKICVKNLGVEFKYNHSIENIFTNYKKITGINTQKSVISGDAYLYCLGSYGISLAKAIGVDLDIVPIKGYSISINSDINIPNIPSIDSENKIVYSKIGNIFRVAGTLEFSNLYCDSKKNKKHINFLKKQMVQTYDFDCDKVSTWFGFRPYRSNCLPIIGRVKYSNFFTNSGHGSLGFTNSFGSAKIISNIINRENDFKYVKNDLLC